MLPRRNRFSVFYRLGFLPARHWLRLLGIVFIAVSLLLFCVWNHHRILSHSYTMPFIRSHAEDAVKRSINEALQKYLAENPFAEEKREELQVIDEQILLKAEEIITARIKAALPKRSSVKLPFFQESFFPFLRFSVYYTEIHTVRCSVSSEIFKGSAGFLYRVQLTVEVDTVVFCGSKWEYIRTEEGAVIYEALYT